MHRQKRSSADCTGKEIDTMKRITLVLGVVAVMVAVLVALAATTMAQDNNGERD